VRLQEQHLATADRPIASCLPRQRQALGGGTKGADTSGCKVDPAKAGRRRNGGCLFARGEERSSLRRIPDGERHPGSRENVALRGTMLERGPRSTDEDGGSIQPSGQTARRRKRDAREAHMRRGTFTLAVLRQQAARGRVLRSGQLGPCSPALSSNGHRRKRWSDRGVARKRRRDRAVAFGVSLCGALAATYGRLRRDCRGSQHSPSFFDRGKSPRP